MNSAAIPTIIVGGYLGAGKTTLINAFLRDPQGLRALVMVNDFGAINIDADLIENTSGDTIALTNGCACCSIGDSLLEAALKATNAASAPELLIVEASGVSRPSRIADTLMGVAALAPANCLTVVNGARATRNSTDKYVGQLFRTQIDTAGFLALNRFEAKQRQAFLQNGPPKPLVNSISELLDLLPRYIGPTINHRPTPEPEDGFRNLTISLETPITLAQLKAWIGSFPPSIERLKGTVMIDNKSGDAEPMLVNYSQGLFDVCTASPKQAANCGTMVMIMRKGTKSDFRLLMVGNP